MTPELRAEITAFESKPQRVCAECGAIHDGVCGICERLMRSARLHAEQAVRGGIHDVAFAGVTDDPIVLAHRRMIVREFERQNREQAIQELRGHHVRIVPPAPGRLSRWFACWAYCMSLLSRRAKDALEWAVIWALILWGCSIFGLVVWELVKWTLRGLL